MVKTLKYICAKISKHAEFYPFSKFLKNDPFFSISQIRASHWKKHPFFRENGYEHVYALVGSGGAGVRKKYTHGTETQLETKCGYLGPSLPGTNQLVLRRTTILPSILPGHYVFTSSKSTHNPHCRNSEQKERVELTLACSKGEMLTWN